MTHRQRQATRRSAGHLALGLMAGTLLLAGCASGRADPLPSAPSTTIRLEPAPELPVTGTTTGELPPLPVAQMEESNGFAPRIQQLDVADQDLRVVVRSLAENFGLDYQIDPSIGGRVSTSMRDVTLEQALDELVLPHGYTYQIQGRVLRITPSRLQTRIFSLDYMSMSRAGVGTTVIQRRFGSTGGIGGAGIGGAGIGGAGVGGFAGGGGGGGADVITSVSVMDLWEEIRISLEGLLFDGVGTVGLGATTGALPAGAAGAVPSPGGQFGGAAGLGGMGGRGAGAYSRVGEDGRRLIINPISGTILVAASPDKLEEIAGFIAVVEGSVQRQVLIEAKIVEVSLNRRFQFGIDWNVVQQVGNVTLRMGAGAGGAQFTLGGGEAPDQEVSVVLRALGEQGTVSVLSSPRVSVMNNQRAVMNVTRDEVFFAVTRQPIIGPTGATIGFDTQIDPQQVAVGIVLDVLAQISPDNTITMNVRPVVTDVVTVRTVQLEDGTQASAPVIDRRETDTVVRVRGGETIVIGGLMQSTREDNESGVPFLRSIPGLGRLFGGFNQSAEKRELVIFITPTIVAGQPPLGG